MLQLAFQHLITFLSQTLSLCYCHTCEPTSSAAASGSQGLRVWASRDRLASFTPLADIDSSTVIVSASDSPWQFAKAAVPSNEIPKCLTFDYCLSVWVKAMQP